MNPYPPPWPPAGPPPPPTGPVPPTSRPSPQRPADLVTGFWLWLLAVPLMVVGQVADGYVVSRSVVTSGANGVSDGAQASAVLVTTVMLAVIIGMVVVTLIVLMRASYRWTRTVLTAGGVATIFYTAASLFETPRPPVPAVIYAVTGIIGSVLIAGGIFLVHRPDSNTFFER